MRLGSKLHTVALALTFPSLLLGFDAIAGILCVRVPLYGYLGAVAMGAAVGPLLEPRLRGGGGLRRLLRSIPAVLATLGLLGAAAMAMATPSWSSKCAWRYCGRALGPSLGRSPFPVGAPSCGNLHMCANEYPFSNDEHTQLAALIRQQGCAEP